MLGRSESSRSEGDSVFLKVGEVLGLHSDQIREFGGAEGIRDQGALESAVAQASTTYAGEYLHNGLFEMAAAYAFHIAENQPFLESSAAIRPLKRTIPPQGFLGVQGSRERNREPMDGATNRAKPP
ncbi:MAG TPA: Fic family protein [Polyangia bacterium]